MAEPPSEGFDGGLGADASDAGAIVGEVLASGQLKPAWLQQSDQNLYWLLDSSGQGAVMKMPIGGGTAVAVVEGLVQPDSLRVDGTRAYWLAYGDQGGIHSVPLGGGAVADLVTVAAPIPFRQIALDPSYVYYTDGPGGAVRRVPKAGGAPADFATGLSGPAGIAIDDTGVYVVESGESGAIVRIPTTGGAGVRLAQSQPSPSSIVLTTEDVYWINAGVFDTSTQKFSGAAVMKVPKSGGPPVSVVTVDGASSLFVDSDGAVYYAVGDGILRTTSGGVPLAFAPAQPQPAAITTDETYVYWVNAGTSAKQYADGDVRRLKKN